jgi:Holliday junction DNA helicase RuvA
VIALHRPDEAAVEETFMNTNAASALKLGPRRGPAPCSGPRGRAQRGGVRAHRDQEAVVGTGGADKTQVAFMVRRCCRRAAEASATAPSAWRGGDHARAHPHRAAGDAAVIAGLRGVLAEVAEEDALIDVGGVGYVVKAGAKTLARLPAVGDELVMHIESVTREDGTRLYGFLTRRRAAGVRTLRRAGRRTQGGAGGADVLPPRVASAIAARDKTPVRRPRAWAPAGPAHRWELKDKPIGGGDVASFLGARRAAGSRRRGGRVAR